MLVWIAASAVASASRCELSAGGQGRWYPDEGELARTYESIGSITAEVSCSRSFGAHTIAAKVFGRQAGHGSARTHADIRELQWLWTGEPWQLRAGIDRVFWGVTEFAHIVDIVNQADVLEDPFGETKMGQPMAAATLRRGWGTISLFALPRFRDRVFPNPGEPMRPAPPFELAAARFESHRDRRHLDKALRYSHTRGPVDMGLSYFEGTSRDPRIETAADGSGSPVVRARYEQISQAGLDLQLTLDEWAFKLEAARRRSPGKSRTAYTVGAEYPFAGIAGTAADLTVVAEYVRDRRDPLPVPGFLDDDWAVGVRLVGNDVRTTEAKIGMTFDRHLHSQAWSIEVGTRVGAHWRLNAQARLFHKVSARDPLFVLHGDGYLDLSLTRYFLMPSQ